MKESHLSDEDDFGLTGLAESPPPPPLLEELGVSAEEEELEFEVGGADAELPIIMRDLT